MNALSRARRREKYLACVRSHLDRVIASGTAAGYGPVDSAMWMSSLDVHTGRYPRDDSRPAGVAKRVYRNIDAPRGCAFYWDQPALAAAYALSDLTGEAGCAAAADAYVGDFLRLCAAANGMFLWGNHYYYDAFRGEVLRFVSSEAPAACEAEEEDGSLHELRPIRPAWEAIWRACPAAAERHIRRMAAGHVFDADAGGFNRHADATRSHAFLEAGGILAEALCFLAARTGDREPAELALRVADFSWRHRDRRTGLLPNNPTTDRWDRHVCTTEVGLWAGCLLDAARRLEDARLGGAEDLRAMAYGAVAAYVDRGYDEAEHRYFGRLRIADGRPDRSRKTTRYQPGAFSDPWEPLFPTHDYPMPLAQSCLRLYELTGEGRFRLAVERWAEIVESTGPGGTDADDGPAGPPDGRIYYAEHFGRCIHFLLDAADVFHEPDLRRQAAALADRAIDLLYASEMFRSHTGEDRCDAVDGTGYLLLALLYLHAGRAPATMGLGW